MVSFGAIRTLTYQFPTMVDAKPDEIALLRDEASKIPVLSERARFLLQSWKPSQRYSQVNARLALFQELQQEARRARDQRGEYYALVGIGRCLHRSVRYDEALEINLRALPFFEGLHDDLIVAELCQNIGVVYRVRGEYQRALDYFQRSLEIRTRTGNPAHLSTICNSIAIVYSIVGNYRSGLENFREALRFYRQAKDEQGESHALINIGHMYVHLGEFDRAEECYAQVRTIREKGENSIGMALLHHAMCELYLKQERLDEAFEYGMKGLEVFRAVEDRLGQIRAYGSLSRIYGKKGEDDKGMELLASVVELAREVGDVDSLGIALVDCAENALRQGNPDDAMKFLREALTLVEEHGMKELEQQIRETLGRCYRAEGDYEKAYRQTRRAMELQVEILGKEKQKALAELQVRFDLENARKEKEIYRLRSQQLEMTNRRQADELAATAISLVRKTELIETLKKQVREALQSAHESFQDILAHIFDAADDRDTASDWAHFEQRLSEAQGGFVRALSAAYPSLTSTERRICSLVLLGLSSHEIAGLMNVTPRNVESHRHRVRKKMELEENVDLVAFLQGFDEQQATRALREEDPGFTRLLSERCPELSGAELKVCTLIRGNFSTKEIAEFLSVSERTVETHRYNIRRKLELPKETNLGSFLSGM